MTRASLISTDLISTEEKMKEYKAALLLLLASVIWGLAFVTQSQAAQLIKPFSYNAIRMLLGALALYPLAFKSFKKNSGNSDYRKNLIKGGLVCGFFIMAASAFQQFGLEKTTAGKAGFITSLYTIFVPVFSVVLGKKVKLRIWFCALMGLFGAFLLSTGAFPSAVGTGDLLIFCCSVLFAFQIMATDHFGCKTDGPDLSFVQFLTGGLFSLVFAFIFETVSWQAIKSAWFQILYAGLFSCAIAYTLQIIGQKHVQPAKATLILCMESIWAVLGGALFLKERMSNREVLGCIILFVSVILSQLKFKKK